jgi:hypothetical protein
VAALAGSLFNPVAAGIVKLYRNCRKSQEKPGKARNLDWKKER